MNLASAGRRRTAQPPFKAFRCELPNDAHFVAWNGVGERFAGMFRPQPKMMRTIDVSDDDVATVRKLLVGDDKRPIGEIECACVRKAGRCWFENDSIGRNDG